MNFPLRGMVTRVFRMFGLVDHQTVYFEGGLGSQILSYLEWLEKKELYENVPGSPPPYCDITYFKRNIGYEPGGLRIGPWLLSEYELQLEELDAFSNPRYRKYLKVRALYTDKASLINGKSYQIFADKFRSKFDSGSGIYNFTKDQVGVSLESEDAEGMIDCCAVHIRRGDYVQVSSHLVSFESYIDLLIRIKRFLPPDIVFFCDSELDETFKETILFEFADKRITFCEGNEYRDIEVHEFMRRSRVLITGNSTFSITAGLLASKETIIFSPIIFFGMTNDFLSVNPFLTVGDFFLFR